MAANGLLLDTTLRALKETSPQLQHFLWQTGGKVRRAIRLLVRRYLTSAQYYGVEHLFTHPDLLPQAPFEESQPRRPEPLHSKIFYYKQLDVRPSRTT